MIAYRIARIETLYEGWRRLLKFTLARPDGRTMMREVLESQPAAAVLPYDVARRTVILVRQLRVPVMHIEGDLSFLEAVAGMLDGGAPEECARREAMEEAGLRLSKLEPVGVAWSAPGITTERVHLFLAPYSFQDRVGAGGGLVEEHEEIEVVEMPLAELAEKMNANAIRDMKTLILAQALRLRHPELFTETQG